MSFWDVFFEDGNVDLIIAPPKKGKTNAMVDMGDHLLDLDYTLLTNIMFFKEKNIERAKEKGWLNPKIKYRPQPKKFKYLPTASELILASTIQEDNVVIVDEAAISASSYKAMSDPSIQFRFLGYTIRKLGSCLVVITQEKSAIVPTLRKHLVTYEVHVQRRANDRRDLEIQKAEHYFNSDKGDYEVKMIDYDTVKNVPPTTLAYDTRHPGGFTWDIDLKELYDEIGRRRIDSVEISEMMPALIHDAVADHKLDEFLKKPKFIGAGKVAELFGISTQTARRWGESGELKAEQNEKGQWFFSIADVKRKAMEMGIF